MGCFFTYCNQLMSKIDWLDMVQEIAVTLGENWPFRIVRIPLDFFQGLENGLLASHNSIVWFVLSVLFFSSFAVLVTRNPGFLNHLLNLIGLGFSTCFGVIPLTGKHVWNATWCLLGGMAKMVKDGVVILFA